MIQNYFITGDKHGNFHTILQNELVKNPDNAVVILGDDGLNFSLNKYDDRLKKEISQNSSCVWYCVRGNHGARPQDVEGYKLIHDDDVNGEVYVQDEYPNIRFFKDWGKYQLGEYTVAVIGGAYSVDKWWRLQRANIQTKIDKDYFNPKKTGWFYNEQLSTDEMVQAMHELSGAQYDFVFSHTCPYSLMPTDLFLSFIDQSTVDNSMEKWMEELKDKFDWNIWLFGHYHADRLERPHVEMYYNDLESLDTIFYRWEHYDCTEELDWWLNKSPNFYMK